MGRSSKGVSAESRSCAALDPRRILAISLAIGSLPLIGQPAFADDDQGAQIAAACASCHDPSGSDRGIPQIAGLDEREIIEAIHAYRESESPSHVMHAVALALSEEELASVARYLAQHGEEESQQ